LQNRQSSFEYRWLTEDPDRRGEREALLHDEERTRRDTFGHAGRRRSFTLGRAAARLLAGDVLGEAPANVPLRRRSDGAVVVEGYDGALSIAHTGPHAVAALAPHPLGVDLERIQPRHPDLPGFLLHPDERRLLERLPLDRTRGVILCWTLKESALKARRSGLRTSPKKLRLKDVQPAAGRALIRDPEGPVALWQARFAERDDCYLTFVYPADAAQKE
jgi:4'-phosphopantetheinyl transferase